MAEEIVATKVINGWEIGSVEWPVMMVVKEATFDKGLDREIPAHIEFLGSGNVDKYEARLFAQALMKASLILLKIEAAE